MFAKLFKQKKANLSQGQSMVELALLFPLLLLLLSGAAEFGFILNEYLSLMDAARNAARFASDGQYNAIDPGGVNLRPDITDMSGYKIICEGDPSDPDIVATVQFYRQTACLVNQELRQEAPTIALNSNGTDSDGDDYLDPMVGNDIVISAFSFTEGQGITHRHPDDNGWSYADDIQGVDAFRVSRFTSQEVTDSMVSLTSPNIGYVLVEIFYFYDHYLKLPWITVVVDDPMQLHAYAFMPLTSAEPTPTPAP